MYKKVIKGILLAISILNISLPVFAKEADTKIIITATDENIDSKDLQYAINSNEDSAYTKENVFEVKKGEGYIVYVKDLAGNISSKIVNVSESGVVTTPPPTTSDKNKNDSGKSNGNTIINVTPYDKTEFTKEDKNDNMTNSITDQGNIVDSLPSDISNVISGDGTVIDTTGTAESGKEFYTIKTKDEHVFFLVIDHDQGSDNVYFLDTVTENDLMSLVSEEGTLNDKNEEEGKKKEVTQEEEKAFLEGTSEVEKEKEQENQEKKDANSSSAASTIIIIIIAGAVGGVYYYFKIYKPKKLLDLADDIEDIEMLDDEEKNPVEFAKGVNTSSTGKTKKSDSTDIENSSFDDEEEVEEDEY